MHLRCFIVSKTSRNLHSFSVWFFGLKIQSCKFFDRSHVCHQTHCDGERHHNSKEGYIGDIFVCWRPYWYYHTPWALAGTGIIITGGALRSTIINGLLQTKTTWNILLIFLIGQKDIIMIRWNQMLLMKWRWETIMKYRRELYFQRT